MPRPPQVPVALSGGPFDGEITRARIYLGIPQVHLDVADTCGLSPRQKIFRRVPVARYHAAIDVNNPSRQGIEFRTTRVAGHDLIVFEYAAGAKNGSSGIGRALASIGDGPHPMTPIESAAAKARAVRSL